MDHPVQSISIFLDFDDTLSDQVVFNLQYCRAIGNCLASEYGGEPEDWAGSAIDMMVQLEADYRSRFRGSPTNGYCTWLTGIRSRSAQLLFEGMALPPPLNAAELSIRIQAEALARCNALFPSAINALQYLQAMGFGLHMASANESAHLHVALRVLDLAEPIEHCYGPDLIDCAKEGPEFYERIFLHSGMNPPTAIIVDNDPIAIGWAHAAGAHAIQADLIRDRHVTVAPGVLDVIADLKDLPDAVSAAAKRLQR